MTTKPLPSPELPDLDRLEALVREYGNTPLLGAGRTRKVVMADIHSMFSRRAQPEGMSIALREVTDKLSAASAENLSLGMENRQLREQLEARAQPEGEAPQAVHVTPQAAAAAGIECGDTACGGCNAGESWCIHAPAAQHAESGAPAPSAERVDAIVTGLYRRFKDWSKRGFGPDDVTWCEVKADVIALIASGGEALAAQSQGAQAPTDEEIIAAVHACGVDTHPSKYDLPALQVEATSVPVIRDIYMKLATRAALAAKAEAPAPGDLALLAALADAADVFMKGGVAPLRPLIDRAKAVTSRAQQAAAPGTSIDTPEFRELLAKVWNGSHPKFNSKSIAALVAHIDSRQAPSAPGTPEAPQTAAARDVLAERQRQMKVEGWTPEHDDCYENFELPLAAASYVLAGDPPHIMVPDYWPWPKEWWKPRDDRRNLVRGAALVLAEIERLDRAAQLDGGQGEGK